MEAALKEYDEGRWNIDHTIMFINSALIKASPADMVKPITRDEAEAKIAEYMKN